MKNFIYTFLVAFSIFTFGCSGPSGSNSPDMMIVSDASVDMPDMDGGVPVDDMGMLDVGPVDMDIVVDDAGVDAFVPPVDAGPVDMGPVDSDNDGVPDEVDVCPGFNDSIDTDSDGVPDGCDACEGFDDNVDSDNDGIPNGCEWVPPVPNFPVGETVHYVWLAETGFTGYSDVEDACSVRGGHAVAFVHGSLNESIVNAEIRAEIASLKPAGVDCPYPVEDTNLDCSSFCPSDISCQLGCLLALTPGNNPSCDYRRENPNGTEDVVVSFNYNVNTEVWTVKSLISLLLVLFRQLFQVFRP